MTVFDRPCLQRMEISTCTSPNDWLFFAQGGANILLQYAGHVSTYQGKLLRLRRTKCLVDQMSSAHVYDFMLSFEEEEVGSFLIDCQLVNLDDRYVLALRHRFDVLRDSNALVVENLVQDSQNHTKLSKHTWIHLTLPDDGATGLDVVLELKPKWLTSVDSTYCRNCSLAQARNERRHFCPLDLVNESNMQQGVADLLRPLPSQLEQYLDSQGVCLRALLMGYLKCDQSIFKKLQQMQNRYPIHNFNAIKRDDDVSDTILRGMSLRDVGVFVKFSIPHVPTELNRVAFLSHIFDLDPKERSRLSYWQDTQDKLEAFANAKNPGWRNCG